MKEQGVVARLISPHLAEVAFQKGSACAKCCACHDVGEGMLGIEAKNDVGAKRDEIVEIEIPSEEIVRGSMVVFLLPIFFLVIGYFIGSTLMRILGLGKWEEGVGIGFGFVSMFLSFFVVKWYDKNVQRKEALRARIVKILP